MKSVISAIILVLSLNAVASGEGPRLAMEGAYKAAEKGKLEKFRTFLTGDALANFGTNEGMMAIATESKTNKKRILQKSLVNETPNGRDRWTRNYDVTVLRKGTNGNHTRIRTVQVVCDAFLERVWRPGHCTSDPRGGYYCEPGRWEIYEVEDCQVSRI